MVWCEIFLSCGRACGPRCIAHFISRQHLLQHTIPLCNTIFQISRTMSSTLCITRPPLALHPVSHCIPHNATFQIISYIGHIIAPHHILHRISQAAPHVLHNCIIPPHQTVITPNSTSHCHVSHNIPYHISIPPHSTSHHLPHHA